MPNISGNVVAVNARLTLSSTRLSSASGQTPITVFSDASGNFTFSNISAGDYRLMVDLSSCTTPPHNTGYGYRQQKGLHVDASNLIDVNFSPQLLNSQN